MNDIIYVDLECLLVKYDTCLNNPNKSYTVNIAQDIPSGYLITVFRNHSKSTKVSYYRGEYFIQNLCSDLRNIGTELFHSEKISMTPLTPKQKKQHSESDNSFICQKKFNYDKKVNITKNFKKLEIMIITQVYTEVQHILNVIEDIVHKEIYLL